MTINLTAERKLPEYRWLGILWSCVVVSLVLPGAATPASGKPAGSEWSIGSPIVSYYQGPGCGAPPRFDSITPAVVGKLADQGFNLCWILRQEEYAIANAAGLRVMTQFVRPELLHSPSQWGYLDANLAYAKSQPNTFAHYIWDEPGADLFPAMGKLVAYIRERDPTTLAYINLFPTYASAAALGTAGDTVTAYREYLRQFVEIVKPDLISWDHYHFKKTDRAFDGSDYFLNLALVREAALKADIPFANVVQACSNGPGQRAPNGDEGRFLAYTTLAYGGQGIFQFVYNAWEGSEHWGGVVNPDRTPTSLGKALPRINPEFAAIGTVLQPLTSLGAYHLGAYHLGAIPRGATGLPSDAAFTVNPPVAPEETNGILLGYFGAAGTPTHVLVVNLDYTQAATTTVVGPGRMAVFDATKRKWRVAGDRARAKIRMMAGGGKLVRLARSRE